MVRISGSDAFGIAAAVFKPKSGKPIEKMSGYTAAYGEIYDGEELLDDGVLLVFRQPRSYTGEDVCEISCHGGIYVTRRVVTACLKAGAEPAAAGEFTKRAFLNGKMSLTQAEAVSDIISAQGSQLLHCSNSQREGALYRRTERIADKIMDVSAQISAWIDYPDDDTPVVTNEWLNEKLSEVRDDLSGLLSGYDKGKLIRSGISCAIVGKPNVGKSTIMNLLSGSERSIVSSAAGTTRDIIEERVELCGTALLLYDCAGLRESDDEIERIGVDIMMKKLETADIAFAVFDGSKALEDEDRRLFGLLENKTVIPIVNKSDLQITLDIKELEERFGEPVVISAKDEGSAAVLENAVSTRLNLDAFSADAGFIANERQRSCVMRAASYVNDALDAVNAGITPDAVGVELEQALEAVYELSGKKASEEIIDEVFKRFCVGK